MQAQRLGSRYLLTDLLGRGAMGRVYRATVSSDDDPTGERGPETVAVKVLRDDLGADPDVVHRFLTEGRLLKTVDHPHVVRIRDLVAEGDRLAIVMDLVDGGDLRRAVPLPCEEWQAARIVSGIARGLAAVHAAGIVHRDLKPENVLVERGPDDTARARIADFGVSRFSTVTTTRTQGMTGTVGYIAPEVARGEAATPAGDLYALGVMLYELRVGHGPFTAEHPLALIRAHAEDPVPRHDGFSTALWTLLETLLAKDPATRPGAAEVSARLDELLAEDDAAEHPAGRPLAPGWFRLPKAGEAPATVPAPVVVPAQAAPPKTSAPKTSAPKTSAPKTSAPKTSAPEPTAPEPTAPETVVVAALPAPATAPVVAGPVVPPPPPPPVRAGSTARPPLPPEPARTGARRVQPRTLVVSGLITAVLIGGAVVANSTSRAIRSDHTVALGNESSSSHDAPVLVPGTSQSSSSGPAVGSSSGEVPAAEPQLVAVPGVRPAARSDEPGDVEQTITRTATAPVVVVAPADHAARAVRTSTATVTETRVATSTVADETTALSSGSAASSSSGSVAGSSTGSSSSSSATSSTAPAVATTPLYRYVNATTGDHFYTTNYAELGAGSRGYTLEGQAANVLPQQAPGSVPLHRYWNAALGDHFYTTSWSELGSGSKGYAYEGVQAYVYPNQVAGTQPLYRYRNAVTGDHFYTTNYGELGGGSAGYRLEGVACYTR